MKILFLDDNFERAKLFRHANLHHDVTWVETAKKAIQALETNTFDFISLDHDLSHEDEMKTAGFTEETGQVVANWLGANPLSNSQATIVVHSFNPVGANLMCKVMNEGGRNCVQSPFGSLALDASFIVQRVEMARNQ